MAVISSVAPNPAPAGSQITIAGKKLLNTTVKFAGPNGTRLQAAIVSKSDTALTVIVPLSAITGNLTVEPSGLPNLATSTQFTVGPAAGPG